MKSLWTSLVLETCLKRWEWTSQHSWWHKDLWSQDFLLDLTSPVLWRSQLTYSWNSSTQRSTTFSWLEPSEIAWQHYHWAPGLWPCWNGGQCVPTWYAINVDSLIQHTPAEAALTRSCSFSAFQAWVTLALGLTDSFEDTISGRRVWPETRTTS